MVRSFRGVQVDMEKLINQQGDAMSLGNTKLNGRGDVVKHGKIVETRAERLKKWLELHKEERATVNLAEDKETKKVEEEIAKQSFEETKRVARPRKNNAEKININNVEKLLETNEEEE